MNKLEKWDAPGWWGLEGSAMLCGAERVVLSGPFPCLAFRIGCHNQAKVQLSCVKVSGW